MQQEMLDDIKNKYRKVSANEAEKHWTHQYNASLKTCSHAFWNGNCKLTTLGVECEVGLRRRSYNILAGSVLNVWLRVENVLTTFGRNPKMQVVRLRTGELPSISIYLL